MEVLKKTAYVCNQPMVKTYAGKSNRKISVMIN